MDNDFSNECLLSYFLNKNFHCIISCLSLYLLNNIFKNGILNMCYAIYNTNVIIFNTYMQRISICFLERTMKDL